MKIPPKIPPEEGYPPLISPLPPITEPLSRAAAIAAYQVLRDDIIAEEEAKKPPKQVMDWQAHCRAKQAQFNKLRRLGHPELDLKTGDSDADNGKEEGGDAEGSTDVGQVSA